MTPRDEITREIVLAMRKADGPQQVVEALVASGLFAEVTQRPFAHNRTRVMMSMPTLGVPLSDPEPAPRPRAAPGAAFPLLADGRGRKAATTPNERRSA